MYLLNWRKIEKIRCSTISENLNMDLENEMIPQIIKVKADNKMKIILYYLNGDKKCETLLSYHFLFRLSLLSKRGLQHWELLLHCSREYLLFKRISPTNSLSFFLEYWAQKIRYDSCSVNSLKLQEIIPTKKNPTYKTQRELNQGIKTEKYEIK